MWRPAFRRFAASLAAAALLCPALASASDTYPELLQEELDMPCAPPCTICHTTNGGGEGTATRDFAGSMVAVGLGGGDDACIPRALRALELGHTANFNACRQSETPTGVPVDTDGDGTPDVTELRAGDDPNRAGADASVCVLKYGCGARIVPEHRPAAGAGVLLLGLVALLRRRNRRPLSATSSR